MEPENCFSGMAVRGSAKIHIDEWCLLCVLDHLDVIVDEPKTIRINVGDNARFYCRTITAPVSTGNPVCIISFQLF